MLNEKNKDKPKSRRDAARIRMAIRIFFLFRKAERKDFKKYFQNNGNVKF